MAVACRWLLRSMVNRSRYSLSLSLFLGAFLPEILSACFRKRELLCSPEVELISSTLIFFRKRTRTCLERFPGQNGSKCCDFCSANLLEKGHFQERQLAPVLDMGVHRESSSCFLESFREEDRNSDVVFLIICPHPSQLVLWSFFGKARCQP